MRGRKPCIKYLPAAPKEEKWVFFAQRSCTKNTPASIFEKARDVAVIARSAEYKLYWY